MTSIEYAELAESVNQLNQKMDRILDELIVRQNNAEALTDRKFCITARQIPQTVGVHSWG